MLRTLACWNGCVIPGAVVQTHDVVAYLRRRPFVTDGTVVSDVRVPCRYRRVDLRLCNVRHGCAAVDCNGWSCVISLTSRRKQGGEAKRGEARRGEARRGEARRGEARRGEARRGEARRGEARRGEARRGEARRGEARRGEARRGEARRGETKRNEAKRSEAKRSEAKRSEAKRSEAKRSENYMLLHRGHRKDYA